MCAWMHIGVDVITERYCYWTKVKIQGVLSGMRRGVTAGSASSILGVRGCAGI